MPTPNTYFSNNKWPKYWLKAAGIYNTIWGACVIASPTLFFELLHITPPSYPQIWQCVGMIVGLYGIGYYYAAHNPIRHWLIIAIGLAGKIAGPLGFLGAVILDQFPIQFFTIIIFNDLIWWYPFSLIIIKIYKENPHIFRLNKQ